MNAVLHQNAEGGWMLGARRLHPGQGALAAAAAEIAPHLAGLGPRDLLVIAGLGLGWHARAALDHGRGCQVLVFEPVARNLALAAALGPELPGLPIACNREELETRLADLLVYGQVGQVRVFCAPAQGQAEPELPHLTAAIVEEQVRRALVDLANRSAKQDIWLDHLAANFKHSLHIPDVTKLAGRYRGIPALIIGAGPSLDQGLAPLASAKLDGVLKLAAASALGPLARAGLAPDMAFALEARDESRQFDAADPARTLLAAASQSHPNHFALWPGQAALYHLSPWAAAAAGTELALPTGGHATSAAFSLAILMGCDPITLVGQDLAYSQGRAHAAGRPGGEDDDLPNLIPVTGVDGFTVQTSVVMASYIAWYREAAAYLARLPRPPRVINATAQGARLDGFEHLSLSEALPILQQAARGHVPPLQAAAQLNLPEAGALGQRLAQLRAQVRQASLQLETLTIEQVLEVWPADSAVGEALRRLPTPAPPEVARNALVRLSDILRRMWEGLYA